MNDRLTVALSRSYRIERELGQGAMATVYQAEGLHRARNLARRVVIPEFASVALRRSRWSPGGSAA